MVDSLWLSHRAEKESDPARTIPSILIDGLSGDPVKMQIGVGCGFMEEHLFNILKSLGLTSSISY